MKRKIYGVPGQLECKLIIHSGSSTAEVNFRGGSIKDIVRCPARFATSRFVEQAIIENSIEFKLGKIVLMDTMEVPDDAEEIARKAQLAPVAEVAANKEAEATAPAASEPTTTPTETATKQQEGPMETATDNGMQKVVVADKSEAVEWLKEHYPEEGYTAVKLRTMAAVNEAGKKHGVVFEIAAE